MFKVKSYKGIYKVETIDHLTFDDNKGDIIVVDSFIWDQYISVLNHMDIFDASVYVLETTEETKTLEESQKLIDKMIQIGFNKSNKLIAVGGGVIQDLVSFTASIYSRGVDWVFYPTTLLAQCDSCIGSKTSINYKGSKNKLGGFHPPKEIYIYRKFLETLPESEIKSGIGEMLHYFLLDHNFDISEKMVNDENVLENIEEYVKESLSIKKEMIEKDEFDKGERNLFNYGHTFGHAIESISNYEVNHGQAVTLGMEIANRISLKKELISKDVYKRLNNILIKNIPNYGINNNDKYVQALNNDKKNISNNLTCILLTSEYAIKTEIAYEDVVEVINELFGDNLNYPIDFMI